MNRGTEVSCQQLALTCQPCDGGTIFEADPLTLVRHSEGCGLCWCLNDNLTSHPKPEPSG